MQPFTTLQSIAVPLIRDNIDTDLIIPSREMRGVSKDGLSDGLFAGWRYKDIDARVPNPDFALNQERFYGATILLGGSNFGSGSSREHAVWALVEYGFRAVIAPSFSPIFFGNCVRNGMLPIVMNAEPIASDGAIVEIDLPAQTVSANGTVFSFDIDAESKLMLVEGLDPIALTLRHGDAIAVHEAADRKARGWSWSVLPAG